MAKDPALDTGLYSRVGALEANYASIQRTLEEDVVPPLRALMKVHYQQQGRAILGKTMFGVGSGGIGGLVAIGIEWLRHLKGS